MIDPIIAVHHEREARLTWVGGEEGVCDCVTLQPEPLSKGTPVVPEAVTIDPQKRNGWCLASGGHGFHSSDGYQFISCESL